MNVKYLGVVFNIKLIFKPQVGIKSLFSTGSTMQSISALALHAVITSKVKNGEYVEQGSHNAGYSNLNFTKRSTRIAA